MQKPTVLVTGQTSFLARHFIVAAEGRLSLTCLNRIDTAATNRKTFDAVVNFACDPSYYANPYADAVDVDRILANRLRGKFGQYFMMSSRVVYGRSERLDIPETLRMSPQSSYAHNKAITEEALTNTLDESVTILRLSNIFGQEQGRRTFAGQALSSLKEREEIVLDIASNTLRDFLPVDDFASALVALVTARSQGIFNLGSGIATTVGDMAAWFVQGYGAGHVHTLSDQARDQFCLDIGALKKIVGEVTTPERIERAAIEAGRKLSNA